MSLSLQNLKLSNFRSYEAYELSSIGPITIFMGPNGVGKTNLLEAIQVLVSQRSFKASHTDQLVNVLSDEAKLAGVLTDGQRRFDLEATLNKKEKARHFQLNGKSKRVSQLQGLAPTVVFTPDHLSLIKKSSSVKRDAIDVVGAQVNANYYQIKKDYDKLISFKNKLLKEGQDVGLIESIDEQLVICGAQLFSYRFALFNKLTEKIETFYQEIAGNKEVFSAAYIPSWNEGKLASEGTSLSDVRDCYYRQLQLNKNEEYRKERALIGPHADQLFFYLNEQPADKFASQGQQRSLVLAFKLAEANIIEEYLGKKPILLLDDVMSELDKDRRAAFINLIEGSIQTFITTTTIEYFNSEIFHKAEIKNIGF